MKTVVKNLKELDYKFQSETEPFQFTKTVQNIPGRDCTGHYSYTAPELWKWLSKKIFTPGKGILFNPQCRMEFVKHFREVNKLTFRQIAEILDCSHEQARQIYLKAYNPSPRKDWSQFREGWKKLWEDGMTIYQISQREKCSSSVIARQLKKAGVETGRGLKRGGDRMLLHIKNYGNVAVKEYDEYSYITVDLFCKKCGSPLYYFKKSEKLWCEDCNSDKQ